MPRASLREERFSSNIARVEWHNKKTNMRKLFWETTRSITSYEFSIFCRGKKYVCIHGYRTFSSKLLQCIKTCNNWQCIWSRGTSLIGRYTKPIWNLLMITDWPNPGNHFILLSMDFISFSSINRKLWHNFDKGFLTPISVFFVLSGSVRLFSRKCRLQGADLSAEEPSL